MRNENRGMKLYTQSPFTHRWVYHKNGLYTAVKAWCAGSVGLVEGMDHRNLVNTVIKHTPDAVLVRCIRRSGRRGAKGIELE